MHAIKVRLVSILVLVLVVASCSEKDTTPPPKPSLDPVVSPTAAGTITLTGSAEYGSTVDITGGVAPVTTKADGFSAQFRADVQLVAAPSVTASPATIRLSVTATDDAGNKSEPTIVEVAYTPLAGPDLNPPTVSVHQVNGYFVCPATGLLTDKADLSDCGTRTSSVVVFRMGSLVVLNVRAHDDRGLQRVAYEASGTNISVAGETLVATGTYTRNTDLDSTFSFKISSWAGIVTVTAQATDPEGNTANSAPAYLDVRFQIAAGDRTSGTVATGAMLSALQDVAVGPTGSVVAANADAALPAVLRIDPGSQSPIVYVDFFPATPQFVTFDKAGNLYTTLDTGELWKTGTDLTTTLYIDPGGTPRGSDTLAGATPATGRWIAQGQIANGSCLSIPVGVTDSTRWVVAGTSGTCPTTCVGGGALQGLTPNACATWVGGASTLQQATALAQTITANSATTGFVAYASNACDTLTQGPGNGRVCLFLVAMTAGTSPGVAARQPLALLSSDGNWTGGEVNGGTSPSTIYLANRNNSRLHQIQAPDTAATTLRDYTFSGGWLNGNLVDVAAAVRVGKGETNAPSRLFTYVTVDSGRVVGLDVASSRAWVVADANTNYAHTAGGAVIDHLQNPWGIAYVPPGNGGDCLLVANRAPSNVLMRGEVLAYTDLDDSAGQTVAPEGGAPIITGLADVRGIALDMTDANPDKWTLLVIDNRSQVIVRVGRSASTTDCF
jgi:hypothetical protein